MSSEPIVEVNAERFVAGRDAYVERVPMLSLVEMIGEIVGEVTVLNEQAIAADTPPIEEPNQHIASFVLGWADGLLNDIRESANWAREERCRQDTPKRNDI